MSQFVTPTSRKRKKTAMLLCVFGGAIGFHYFYVGRYLRGFIAMFTGNFFLLGWFADMVTIASGRFKDQYGEYLKE